MFNYGSDNHDLLWNSVSGDHEAVQKRAGLTHAKVAVAQYWPFLSRAVSQKDFENRLSLTQDRIAALVPAESFEDVLASLRDDFRALAGKGENPFAKDDDSDDDEADNDDKDSKDDDSDDDSDDSDDSKSDDDDDDDDDDSKKSNFPPKKKSDSKKDSDSDDSEVDHQKPDFLRGKKTSAHQDYAETTLPIDTIPGAPANNSYQPDPNKAWRYHQGYEGLTAPVNNGDSQGPDGFPVNLAEGEGRSNTKMIEYQLTPGTWTQHDGMPERPMPFSQQRGYMPVNASTQGVACTDGNCKAYHWSTAGKRYGLPSDHKGQTENVGLKPITTSYHYDADGFVVTSGALDEALTWGAGVGLGTAVPLAGRYLLDVPDAISGNHAHNQGYDQGHSDGFHGRPRKVTEGGEGLHFYRHRYNSGYSEGYEHGLELAQKPSKTSGLEYVANKYIKQQGGKWVIIQKGTGKVLSHHDSEEEANASFRAMEMHKHEGALRFDRDGFVVEADNGRGVDQLHDPVPGQPQRHNPFYFQEGSSMGGNAGFPTDPAKEPLPNNLDDIYGDVAPVSSSGSAEGQVDGDGYSRLNSTSSLRFDAQGYLVEPPNFT